MTEDLTDADEERWCAEQRENVLAYLNGENFQSPNVGDWPAWHIAPLISIWAIESQSKPGWVGWWAVSGDFPTDYVTCGAERHPRQALRDIGRRWKLASEDWQAGRRTEGWEWGSAERERELAPLLASRAKLFFEIAEDDANWQV